MVWQNVLIQFTFQNSGEKRKTTENRKLNKFELQLTFTDFAEVRQQKMRTTKTETVGKRNDDVVGIWYFGAIIVYICRTVQSESIDSDCCFDLNFLHIIK